MIHFCNMLLSVIKPVHTAQKASLPVHLSYHRNVLLPGHISRRFLPHPSSTQIEEWIGGGSEFGANLFYLYVRYGIILFILLLVPALNLSGITLSRMRRRMAELGVRRAFGATQGTILWQVLSENMVLTLLGGLLGLAMS